MIRRLLPLSLFLAFALTACVRPGPIQVPTSSPPPVKAPEKDYERELPAGAHALRRIDDPTQLPDLGAGVADRAGLAVAVERSLNYLKKPSSEAFFPISGLTHEQVRRSLEVYRDLLKAELSDDELLSELRRRFDVYTSVGCDDRGTVLFTGYYTPIFEASKEPRDGFLHPLHRPPTSHVKDLKTGKTLGLRQADGSVKAGYPDREALLDSSLLSGRELVWLRDAFEAYLVGVQGSAILRLPDDTRLEVGYAGTNGHPYASLGRALLAEGKLTRRDLNLKSLLAYFHAHPDDFIRLSRKNKRYVFFQESSGGPYGSLNEKVMARRSIALDKSIFPRGALCFIEAPLPLPNKGPDGQVRRFVLDQDTGGAIRAPGRCDVFMGVGEAAGQVAGRTLAEGRLYVLILKDEELYSYR